MSDDIQQKVDNILKVVALGNYEELRDAHDHAVYFSELPADIQDDELITYLIDWLDDDEDSARRLQAVKALDKFRKVELIDYIAQVLKDEDWQVRAAAVDALSNFDESGIAPILTALDEEEDYILDKIGLFLAKYPDKTLEPLLEAVTDINNDVEKRRGAAYCLNFFNLNAFNNIEIMNPLLAIFEDRDEDEWLRQNVASALGQFPVTNVKEILIEAFENRSENAEVRAGVAQGLTLMQGIQFDEQVGKILLEALNDSDAEVRQKAVMALAKTEQNLLYFVKSLNDSVEYVRYTAIHEIGKLKSIEAIEHLRLALHKESNQINFEKTVRILINYNDEQTIAPLVAALMLIRSEWLLIDEWILNYLVKFKEIAFPLIAKNLQEKYNQWLSKSVIRHVVQRLIELGGAEALPLLEWLKDKGTNSTRQAAEQALAKGISEAGS